MVVCTSRWFVSFMCGKNKTDAACSANIKEEKVVIDGSSGVEKEDYEELK